MLFQSVQIKTMRLSWVMCRNSHSCYITSWHVKLYVLDLFLLLSTGSWNPEDLGVEWWKLFIARRPYEVPNTVFWGEPFLTLNIWIKFSPIAAITLSTMLLCISSFKFLNYLSALPHSRPRGNKKAIWPLIIEGRGPNQLLCLNMKSLTFCMF